MASIAAIIGMSASSATLMVLAMMIAAMIAQQGRAPKADSHKVHYAKAGLLAGAES